TRFVSGIDVDPSNPNHAFLSYSGYNAHATAASTAQGHVFEATYDPVTHSATFSADLATNLGDQPVRALAVDWQTGDIYAATDFNVFVRKSGSANWLTAASGLPKVASYGLTLNVGSRVLYAATHGRGIYSLTLP
ncbi:MAG TPA: exo-alpha-sialidase, partial [Verrucomicrobiae bacterium]|nr:exo-alpha-sialidase [Verrucomicrobiae bacterium]